MTIAAAAGIIPGTMPLDAQDILTKLGAHPIVGLANRADIEAVAGRCRSVRYRVGRKFLREGEPAKEVFLLVEGGVRVFQFGPGGREIVVKLFRAPALFGEAEVMLGMPWLESVEALLASEVIHIPGAVFVHLLSRSVAMANALAVDLAKRVLIDSELSRQLAFGSAESVLASFLLDYAELFGVATDEGVRLEVRLNQQNLARSLSLSRKTVQRTIGQWIDGGVLMRRQGRFVLRKPEALQALSVRRQFGRAYSLQVKEQTP